MDTLIISNYCVAVRTQPTPRAEQCVSAVSNPSLSMNSRRAVERCNGTPTARRRRLGSPSMNRLRAVERCNGPARRRRVGGGRAARGVDLHICFPSDNKAVFFFGEKKRRRLGQRTSSVRSRCVTSNSDVVDIVDKHARVGRCHECTYGLCS